MTRYYTCKGNLPFIECTKAEYVKLEKFTGIHPGNSNEPITTGFTAKGFSGDVRVFKDKHKDEMDNILEAFLAKGKL